MTICGCWQSWRQRSRCVVCRSIVFIAGSLSFILFLSFSSPLLFFFFSQDLDKKFNATTQYVNMKKMLETKNEQIKELRAQLGSN
jgi:hypothetical protein